MSITTTPIHPFLGDWLYQDHSFGNFRHLNFYKKFTTKSGQQIGITILTTDDHSDDHWLMMVMSDKFIPTLESHNGNFRDYELFTYEEIEGDRWEFTIDELIPVIDRLLQTEEEIPLKDDVRQDFLDWLSDKSPGYLEQVIQLNSLYNKS